MPEKNAEVRKTCRNAVKRLHEVLIQSHLAQMNLTYRENRYSTAVTFFTLWVGFTVADFLAAATVVYSVGPAVGMIPEYVFWNPEGAVFMNLTWFGLGLILSLVLAFISFCYSMVCSSSLKAARKKVIEMDEKVRDAKSTILEVCPVELWYSGEA